MTTNVETSSPQRRQERTVISDDVSFLMARANAVSLSAANARLSTHGLRVRSYSVLALACDESRPSQKEIAEFLRLDPSQVVSLIDDLQQSGLVERVPDTRDRRSNVLVATDEGRKLHSGARRDVRMAEDELLAGLAPNERDLLRSVLQKLAFPAS